MAVTDKIFPFINPTLDIPSLQEEFRTTKKCIIKNWLGPETAEQLWNYLDHEMPDWWWSSSSVPSFTGKGDYNACDKYMNTPQNQHNIRLGFDLAHKALDEGQFSYFFWRTFDDHPQDCICQECQFKRFLRGQDTIEWLNQITNLNLSAIHTCFPNRYDKGCFLSTHTDDHNGKLAYVYHLSKNWNPCWGGMYFALDKELKNVTKAVTPTFNQLVVFEVGNNETPHCVTEVAQHSTQKRLSFSGWYQ